MNQRIVALHGFGGRPSDWEAFDQAFAGWPLHKINLFSQKPLAFDAWAAVMADELASFKGRQVLLGYSLGGRLAAHLLVKCPELFAGAIFVSVNPGLAQDSDRAERRKTDAVWAEKWATLPWPELQNQWNAQAVFQSRSSKLPVRDEADFDRSILGEAMRVWSLGEQMDLRSQLAESTVRQLWLAGHDDQKFVKMGADMAQLSTCVQFESILQAGHRVPWDQPLKFAANVTAFLESL